MMMNAASTSARRRLGLVLAAGKGTRMKSALPKVLHPVIGKPMLRRVLEQLIPLDLDEVFVVVGHQAEQVEQAMAQWSLPLKTRCVLQTEQHGTGHAVMQVLPYLPKDTPADVLITCGDMPLIPSQRYLALMDAYTKPRKGTSKVLLALATVHYKDPTGYGRVFWSAHEGVTRIVEHRDATDVEKTCHWGNTGIYAGDWPTIAGALDRIEPHNAQKEYYLTDIVQILHKEGLRIEAVQWPEELEVMGINSRQQLSEATSILSYMTAQRLMEGGVSIVQPQSSLLAPEVEVAADSTILPGCVLEGPITIGSNCEIGPNTTMRGPVTIGNHCRVVQAYLERSVTLKDHCYVGPYVHLRDNTEVGQTCRLGNFVEVKEATIGDRSNAAHLCYLGDVTVGDDVNMGAGSIVANYDPIRDLKHRSTIESGVKVGCNSVLVSPLTVGHHACVAAGSVVTKNVNPWELVISRAPMVQKEDWVKATQQTAAH